MSYLLLTYYLLITAGIGLAGLALLKCTKLFAQLPLATRLLLVASIFPTLVNWTGFFALFRIWFLPELLGFAAAAYATRTAWLARSRIYSSISGYLRQQQQWPLAIACAVLLATFCYSHWCYVYGGSNNFPIDEIRGFSFTSSLSANYLKPAHQIDMSQPIRYGYNFFQYTAFLYSAVHGYYWPSITLWLGALVGIAIFYTGFVRFARLLVRRPSVIMDTLAVLFITFWGMDSFTQPDRLTRIGYIEFWNLRYQITQTSTMWSLLYHYLASAGLALEALVCLQSALRHKQRDYFIAAVLLMASSITFAALSGMFFSTIAGIATVVFVLLQWRNHEARKWWFARIKDTAPACLLLMAATLIPAIFIWIGGQEYMGINDRVTLLFGYGTIESASWEQWQRMLGTMHLELGTLHTAGLLATPVAIMWQLRRNMALAIILAVLSVMIFVSLCCVYAVSPDWNWRTGGLGIMILSSLMAVWLCDICSQQGKDRWRELAYFGAIAWLLYPGVANFYFEQHIRYTRCFKPSLGLLEINRLVDLHTTINGTANFSPNDMYFAGRAAVRPDHNGWTWLHVHGLPPSLKDKWFNSDFGKWPCIQSWYSSTTPDGRYADLERTKTGYQLLLTNCVER
jgi:hypothetical protein